MLSQLSFFSTKKRKDITDGLTKFKVTAIKEILPSTQSTTKANTPVNSDTSTITTVLEAVSLKVKDALSDKKDPPRNDAKIIENFINDRITPVNRDESVLTTVDDQLKDSSIDPSKASMVRLSFHCQLAHGSPTKIISGFASVKDLYDRIASSFEIPVGDILFCTLNTPKIDMDHLFAGQIGRDDFIFVHCKGQIKEVEITKNEELLGLTITDNGNGFSFIKKIHEKSLIESIKFVSVGDVVERIDGKSCIGRRHFEVARALKAIPMGTTFNLCLIEPNHNGFALIGPKDDSCRKQITTGRETLRFRAKGIFEEVNDNVFNAVMEKINKLLESFMGIYDNELAMQFLDIGAAHDNPHEFVMAIKRSDLEIFEFNEDLLFDLWGEINDYRMGRMSKKLVE
ncbi:PDZ domain-containing protein GIPC-like protein kermit [Brevipalpus obovatus]|uniref:PDZ domain-containing protein GIPC-like protein kermit n=1 Tax=Brevipalpus obovatus TaxID=246614 RepID=UPI003D9EBDB4